MTFSVLRRNLNCSKNSGFTKNAVYDSESEPTSKKNFLGCESILLDQELSECNIPAKVFGQTTPSIIAAPDNGRYSGQYHPKHNILTPRPRILYYRPREREILKQSDSSLDTEETVSNLSEEDETRFSDGYHPRPLFRFCRPRSGASE